MKHADIIQKLNLEQKCALLSGETVFTTRALPGKGIPAIPPVIALEFAIVYRMLWTASRP